MLTSDINLFDRAAEPRHMVLSAGVLSKLKKNGKTYPAFALDFIRPSPGFNLAGIDLVASFAMRAEDNPRIVWPDINGLETSLCLRRLFFHWRKLVPNRLLALGTPQVTEN